MKNHQNNIIRTKNITKCLLLEVQNDYTKNWYVKTTKIFVCQSVLSQPLWQIQPSRGQNGLQACTMGSNSLKYESKGWGEHNIFSLSILVCNITLILSIDKYWKTFQIHTCTRYKRQRVQSETALCSELLVDSTEPWDKERESSSVFCISVLCRCTAVYCALLRNSTKILTISSTLVP